MKISCKGALACALPYTHILIRHIQTPIHIIIYIFRVKSFPFHFLMHYSCAYILCAAAIAPFIIRINRCDVVRQLACSVIHVCINRWDTIKNACFLFMRTLRIERATQWLFCWFHYIFAYTYDACVSLYNEGIAGAHTTNERTNERGFSICSLWSCNFYLKTEELTNSKRKIIAEVATNMQ